jgi:hypothetical protein
LLASLLEDEFERISQIISRNYNIKRLLVFSTLSREANGETEESSVFDKIQQNLMALLSHKHSRAKHA